MSGSKRKFTCLISEQKIAQAGMDAYTLRRLRSVTEQVNSILWKKKCDPPPGLEWVKARLPWAPLSVGDEAITLLEVLDRGHGGMAQVRCHHIGTRWLFASVWQISREVRAFLNDLEKHRAQRNPKSREAAAQKKRQVMKKMEADLNQAKLAYRAVTLELEKYRGEVESL